MWIVPNTKEFSRFVPDTEDSKSVLKEQLEKSPYSLMWRSKHSPLQTWLTRWKRERWFRHLSGRILKPSLRKSFEDMLTSSLAATRASHSAQQESDSEKKIPDTCGRISETSSMTANHPCASSKTLKVTSRLDSPLSSVIWKKMVTNARGEYSQRLKSARLTREKGCLSWPTMAYHSLYNRKGASKHSGNWLATMVNRESAWPTPAHRDWKNVSANPEHNRKRWEHARGKTLPETVINGPHAQENHSTNGKNPESWPTPSCPGKNSIGAISEWGGSQNPMRKDPANHKAKLNPNWVEQLMGLPVGWTDLDYSVME